MNMEHGSLARCLATFSGRQQIPNRPRTSDHHQHINHRWNDDRPATSAGRQQQRQPLAVTATYSSPDLLSFSTNQFRLDRMPPTRQVSYSDCRSTGTLSTISPTTPIHAHQWPREMFISDHALGADQYNSQPTQTPSQQKTTSMLSAAIDEASFLLGGLVKHPTESTKHYTILRHGTGLVYYKGPSTSIALTVFADRRLPQNRRYWLQTKGWSGRAGMKVEAIFRSNSDWIDVTPARLVCVADLAASDERAWQRDIRNHLEKPVPKFRKHTTRETVMLRVPAEAIDGYFRVMMTHGDSRSILCPSPVFRVASTSLSAGSIKGASLATLPLELSVHILQYAAKQTVEKVIAPWAVAAQKGVNQFVSATIQDYAKQAYEKSGAHVHVDYLQDQYNLRVEQAFSPSTPIKSKYTPMQRLDVVGNFTGPESPFPVQLKGTVIQGTGRGTEETGIPTANLAYVPAYQLSALLGVYFGWALVTPKDKSQDEVHSEWRHSIISITYDHSNQAEVASRKIVKAYLLHSFGGQYFFDARITLNITGYLRPLIPHTDQPTFFTEVLRDVEITRASLARESWTAQAIQDRLEKTRSDKGLVDRCVDMRIAAQRRIDSLPLHKLGIRRECTKQSDRGSFGNGGFFVSREAR